MSDALNAKIAELTDVITTLTTQAATIATHVASVDANVIALRNAIANSGAADDPAVLAQVDALTQSVQTVNTTLAASDATLVSDSAAEDPAPAPTPAA